MSSNALELIKFEEMPLEIIDGDRGKNYPKKEDFTENGYCLFLNTGNVRRDGFDFQDLQFITIEKDRELRKGKLRRNDIVLTTRGTLGNIGLYDETVEFENLRINSGMVILRVLNEQLLSVKYLYQFLKSNFFIEQVFSFSSGSAQPQLPIKDLKQIKVRIPDIVTQNKIAFVLSTIDGKIENNLATNQTIEEIARTLFKEWFVNFNYPGGDGNLKHSEFGEIPGSWEVGKLGDVCTVNKNTLNTKSDSLEWIDYIEISEVSRGQIGNVTRYNLGEEPSRAKRKLKHGDTVLSTVRPDRGSYFLAFNPNETDIASTGFAVFSPTKVPFSFLYLFLTNEVSLKYYGQVANGGAYPAINPNTIMEMDLTVPDENTLSKFHGVVKHLFEKMQDNLEENKTLRELRGSLLPKLMSGEIEVNG